MTLQMSHAPLVHAATKLFSAADARPFPSSTRTMKRSRSPMMGWSLGHMNIVKGASMMKVPGSSSSTNRTGAFWGSHETVRGARRDGDVEARFPYGTYAMRAYHGAPVETEPLEVAQEVRKAFAFSRRSGPERCAKR